MKKYIQQKTDSIRLDKKAQRVCDRKTLLFLVDMNASFQVN